MKKENIKDIVIFIVLIVLIIGVLIFNYVKDHNQNMITTKNNYVIGNYTYDSLYKDGIILFFNGVDLLNPNAIFKYELDNNNKYMLYSFDNYKNLKKITNYNIVLNTLNKNDIEKYSNENSIIRHDNEYYIENIENKTNNFVGSMIDIDSYNDNEAIFESVSYFCKEYSYNYTGLLDKEPECEHTKKELKYTIILEDDNLRLKDYEEIKSLVK